MRIFSFLGTMEAKRRGRKRRASKVSDGDDNSRNLFRSLASEIMSDQVAQHPILKRLLYLLGHLSLTQPIYWNKCGVASPCWNIKLSGDQVESINFEDVCYLSDVLFTELDRRFKDLFSTLSKHKAEPSSTCTTTEEIIEVAVLFLRCCMKIMTLLMSKGELVLEKSKTLLSILSELIHAKNGDSSDKLMNQEYATSITSEPLDPYNSFLLTGLEVIMDEILVNKSIRDLILLVDSAFSSGRLFSKHDMGLFDMASVLEMVSAHFILSLSNERMNRMYVDRLYWKQFNELRTPQISLSAVVSLLLNPVMLSAPRMIHPYVILLVSDTIGICPPLCVKGLDRQLFDCYIDAFEKSVVLYTKHICKGGNGVGENVSSGKFDVSKSNAQVAFEHLLLPSTLEKVNHLTLKLNDSWSSYRSSNALRENDELVASSVAYAKVSLCVFDTYCSENMLSQALSILGCLILRASSDDVMDYVLQKHNASIMEDIYLLASTLKLMSCSMLQAIRVLRNCKWHQSEATGDVRACKEYKAMMGVAQRFEQLTVHLPGQSLLGERMDSHSHRYAKSKWMLMHFSGLLSLSYALKLDFLIKDSIFVMVISLYMFILEEGDLEVLRDSVCHSTKSSLIASSNGSKDLAAFDKAEVAAVDKKLSEAVALKFQKIRTLYLGKVTHTGSEKFSQAKDPGSVSNPEDLDSTANVQEKSCNGEGFLLCMARKGKIKRKDVEDLADFIACEPGKDYSDWLKGRERYRRQGWKSEKIGIHRWNKKQKAWRENKRKIS